MHTILSLEKKREKHFSQAIFKQRMSDIKSMSLKSLSHLLSSADLASFAPYINVIVNGWKNIIKVPSTVLVMVRQAIA